MTKQLTLLPYLFCLLIVQTYTQTSEVNLILTTPLFSQHLVTNGVTNPSFTMTVNKFDCSLCDLFTYQQTPSAYRTNAPYQLILTGLTQPTTVSLRTIHSNLDPELSASGCQPPSCNVTSLTCQPPSCNLTVVNNCQHSLNFFNYFDRLILEVQNLPDLSYYVVCNQDHPTNTFQWGMVIIITAITVLIAVVALYSRAWSLGGQGLEIKIWMIILFQSCLVLGAVIGYFSNSAIDVILTVITFVLGILGVAICTNEILFLLRMKCLLFLFFKAGTFEFRMLEVVSLGVGTCLSVGWFYSHKNIILNDAICFCMIVGFIKVLKFTSFKIAVYTFAATMFLELVIAFLIYYVMNQSYNNLFLNQYNFPIELQAPTINPVYDQKCSWLPITAVIFPGMTFSYIRRFDTSRSTSIYLIIASLTFLVGGIAWMFVSIICPISLPFGLVSEPCMFSLIALFSFRRRQIRTLWDGLFYDPQFSNRKDLQVAIEMIGNSSRRSSVKTIESSLMQELKGGRKRQGSFRSTESNVIRSKFMGSQPHEI